MSHQAIADFDPTGTTEIEIRVGDKFKKVKYVGNGWSLGTNSRTQETGVFPTSYVEKLETLTTNIVRRLTKKKSARAKKLGQDEENIMELDEMETQQNAGIDTAQNDTDLPSYDQAVGMDYYGTDTELDDTDINFETDDDQLSDHGILDTDNDVQTDDTEKTRHAHLSQMKNFADKLFSSDRNDRSWQKALLGVIMGLLSGTALFFILAYGYNIATNIAGFISLGLTFFFCLGLSLSVHCRCIGLLMLPSIASGRGRALLLAIIISILLSGPIQNISNNATEVSTSMACSMTVIHNQTTLLKEQLQEPINQAADQISENTAGLRAIGNAIEKAFSPIASALNSIHSGATDALNALNAASTECKRVFNDAYDGCVREINNAKSKCQGALGPLGKKRKRRSLSLEELFKENPNLALAIVMQGIHKSRKKRGLSDLCNVLDISGVCQVLNVGDVLCAPVSALDSAANTIAENVKDGLDEIESWFAFDVVRNLGLSGLANSTKTAAEFILEVSTELTTNIDWVNFVVTLLTNLLALTLLLLFIQSFVYMKQYLSKDEFNNVYITSAFKAYDKEREENGESFILPLKKREKRMYTDTKSIKLSQAEIRSSTIGLLQVILHLIFVLLVIFFDYILYYCIYLINRYGRVNIELTGQSSILLQITGTGEVAKLLRSFITGINLNSAYEADFNITSCLPAPYEPNSNLLIAFGVMYILVIMAVLFQAYGLRLRRKICAYYYPEQEHERMLFLHKKIRHDRKTHQLQLKQHLRSMKKEKEKKRKSMKKIPFANKFAKKTEARTCLNCGTNEGGKVNFMSCPDPTCDADYCETCVAEIDHKCQLCGGTLN